MAGRPSPCVLGHRTSEDFDFFSSRPFTPEALQKAVPYVRGAEITQSEDNTFTVIVYRTGPIKVSFFGGLTLNRVQDPEQVDQGIRVASLLDVGATKMSTVQQRAQAKDYLDVVALAEAGVSLADALSAAAGVYGPAFNGILSLKALTYSTETSRASLRPSKLSCAKWQTRSISEDPADEAQRQPKRRRGLR